MLAVAEQAFLAFLEDAQEAFNIMTSHAARRKAVKDQELRNSSNSGRSSSSSRGSSPGSSVGLSSIDHGLSGSGGQPWRGMSAQSPPIVFTKAHIDFMNRLGDVMTRLPRAMQGSLCMPLQHPSTASCLQDNDSLECWQELDYNMVGVTPDLCLPACPQLIVPFRSMIV